MSAKASAAAPFAVIDRQSKLGWLHRTARANVNAWKRADPFVGGERLDGTSGQALRVIA